MWSWPASMLYQFLIFNDLCTASKIAESRNLSRHIYTVHKDRSCISSYHDKIAFHINPIYSILHAVDYSTLWMTTAPETSRGCPLLPSGLDKKSHWVVCQSLGGWFQEGVPASSAASAGLTSKNFSQGVLLSTPSPRNAATLMVCPKSS